jgi:hypothetical protein
MEKRQCKNILVSGAQCSREALVDGDHCSKCSGGRGDSTGRQYDLATGADRVTEFADADLTLKDEAAIMQMLFERRVNHIAGQGDEELALQTGPLMDLLTKISNVKEKRDQMERRRGDLLDKARVNELANELLSAVVEVLTDEIEDVDQRKTLITTIARKFLSLTE